MDVRTLAVALIAGLNAMVEKLEEAVSADGEEEQEEKPARRSRSRKEEEEEESEEKPARRSRSKKDEEEEDDDKDDSDAPSEDDIIDAVRAAQKVLAKDDVVAVIRKYGKKDRASQVPEDRRQAVIDALEKAIDEAK